MKAKGELKDGRPPVKNGRRGTTVLKDADISKDQSSRWQKIAKIPEVDRECYIAEKKDSVDPISSNEILKSDKKKKNEKKR